MNIKPMKLLWFCVFILSSCATRSAGNVPLMVVGDVVNPGIYYIRDFDSLVVQDIVEVAGGVIAKEHGSRLSVVFIQLANPVSGEIRIYEKDFSTPLSRLGIDLVQFQKLRVDGGRL
jgi:protein involved in polysaccharide export with SLBB domain